MSMVMTLAMVMWTVVHQEQAGLLENLARDPVVTLNYALHCCGCNGYIFVGLVDFIFIFLNNCLFTRALM
jgi:hypothetical protein